MTGKTIAIINSLPRSYER